MKILERGSIIVALIGLSMKILSRTGGNELLMIGTTVLAIVYFFLGFALLNNIQLRAIFEKSSYASVSGGRIMGAIGVCTHPINQTS